MKEYTLNVIHPETSEAEIGELLAFSKSSRARKLAHNTYLEGNFNFPDDHGIVIRYHNTDIITYYVDGSIRLDTNGWQTSTTKARFAAFLPRRISVHQSLGAWYVTTPEGVFDFEDGMVVSYEGFTDAKVADEKADAKEYRRQKRVEKKRSDARAEEYAERFLLERPAIGPRNRGVYDGRFAA